MVAWVLVGIAAFLVYAVFFPNSSWIRNAGLPDLRNSALRDKLRTCASYGVVNADVYYDGTFATDVVVFDLLDGSSSEARRIDPVHLFLQFTSELDLYSIDRVILARNGEQIFYVDATDLRPLAESYEGGGANWSFNHLPKSVRTMGGGRAYDEWTGTWLGVLAKQTEDLNDFIRAWTGF